MAEIQAITVPKWGLSMREARVTAWLKPPGASLQAGEGIVELESDKISGTVECLAAGVLRRQLADVGDVVLVGGLLGVIAVADVPEPEIDRAVGEFQSRATIVADLTDDSSDGMKTIAARTWTLRYLKRGTGPEAVILIHGFGGDLNNWVLNHEVLAQDRTVYALDLPGHGGTSKHVGAATVAELADAAAEFMDRLGIDTAHLVGHSLGGAVALALAAERPSRVRSLTLVASAGLGSEIDADYIKGFVSADSRQELRPKLLKLFADPNLVTRARVDEILKYKRLENVGASLHALASHLIKDGRQAASMRSLLDELDVRVLVLWGASDRILPATHAQGLPARVEVQVLSGQGHMLMMEAAAEFNQRLRAFWASLSAF